ncbi:MAG: tRNA pseudouridine(55) synthase TruB [Bacteroidales bacterium]|uniref:tRNA pseudouridine(55) synthase TruB n=1 Tax=Porphyromonas sp. TaxID=1924944 RepID=UPI00297A8E80|nr:tRNA pseudouridine(55) synthase TruB [Porphyromonas sp.]MDD7438667.1 tRNA pseudouridine(55) synthase TruB [Bacteroidales bacterium]MDY3066925.1 tRNA pseudouridine(55) synthase TruB [Porphyromonas sp.]
MFVVVDKPLEWTSFDVVNKFRYIACRKLGMKKLKVGHAGTLDPLATGVVVICTGKYTKRIEEVQRQEKVYTASVRLGATTPSFDLESEVDAIYPTEHITQELVEEVLRQYEGEIDQVPPTFSAVKVDGKRAYEYARKGEDLELDAKRIRIHKIELLRFDLPSIEIKVTCGKGTYIRALARDIGKALGSGGHLTALRRERVGAFGIEGAIGVEEFSDFIEQKLEQYKEE